MTEKDITKIPTETGKEEGSKQISKEPLDPSIYAPSGRKYSEIEEYVSGLRAMVTALETALTHVPTEKDITKAKPLLGISPSIQMYFWAGNMKYGGRDPLDVVKDLIHTLGGKCEKDFSSEEYVDVKWKFGPHTLKFLASKENICRKRVVGKRIVQKPKYTSVTVDVEEEIIEWDCPPSLLNE